MELLYHESTTTLPVDKSRVSYISGSDTLPLIRFSCFDELDWMDACFTTKFGGVSTGYLSSLNLGDCKGDDPENISENYTRIADLLGISPNNLVKTDQVHDTVVSYVGNEHLPAGPGIKKFPKTDGLFTDLCGVALCIGGADCVPILLAAKDTKDIAGVHSGWRGTVGRIGKNGVDALISRGADPKNIIALIGPSICKDNYEVTSEVVDAFKNAGFSDEQIKDIATQTDDIHYQLDLWAACAHVLSDAGLPCENIHLSGICTFENHDLLFSHRYTNGLRGSQNAVIFKHAD